MGNFMDNLGTDMTNEKYDWFGWLILTAFIFTGIGYAWAWHHGKIQLERAYEQGYEATVDELMVVVRGEICQ